MTQKPIRHYCTYFDSNYLARGLVLHQSLEEHSEGDFRLYVLCLDDRTHEILTSLGKKTIVPIRLGEIEAWDADLLEAKKNRSRVEYYFTLSPILPLYVLEHFDCNLITYLDADLMFFSSPEAIFEELGDRSIFITEHRFPESLKHLEKYGRFNVQCQSFRRDETGLACLRRWREQCLEWCYDRLEDGKFADQKYLDEWASLYGEGLAVSKNPGIGVAPWNVGRYQLIKKNGYFFIDGKCRLVFYHFHGLKRVFWRYYRMGLSVYGAKLDFALAELYKEYAGRLKKFIGVERGGIDVRHGRKMFRIFLGGLKNRDLQFL